MEIQVKFHMVNEVNPISILVLLMTLVLKRSRTVLARVLPWVIEYRQERVYIFSYNNRA